MRIPIELTDEQYQTVIDIETTCVVINDEGGSTDTITLAKLKARCEEFLRYPVIQALNTEGL